jgi:DNA-binding response OmpR family regulator
MNCSPRILLVDDDALASRFLADNLCADGFEVATATSGPSALRRLSGGGVDLAIIEPDLPDGDGLELIAAVRGESRLLGRLDPAMPLIILSARTDEVDRIRGLERGADDYVCKPFSYGELLRRIRARLRTASQNPARARTRVGPIELDAVARQVWLDGEPIALTSKEFSLLRTLASDPSRVFSREELLTLVWGWAEPVAGATRTVDGHALRLRRKLGARGGRFVINVWGVGYRLVDAVPA